MDELYKRFKIELNIENVRQIFKNKIKKFLIHGQIGKEIFSVKDIMWDFCNKVGINYEKSSFIEINFDRLLGVFKFEEYLFRLQVLLNILFENGYEVANNFGGIISEIINNSPIGLGIKIKTYKTRAPQIYFGGSKLANRAIEDVLDILDIYIEKNSEYQEVAKHFGQGLKEFLLAQTDAQLKDVVEDMTTACDSAAQIIFKNKKSGFRNLLKDRAFTGKFNPYQKQIFSNLCDWMDKIKHNALIFKREDIENIVHLTSIFLKFVLK